MHLEEEPIFENQIILDGIYKNPTLSIIQYSIKLADNLKDKFIS